MEYKSDVVVIGGGISGIVTSLELLNKNKKVLILERNDSSKFGGLAPWASAGIFIVDSPDQRKKGIKDSVELALSDWIATAEFGEADIWPRRWAEQYVNRCNPDVYRWLKELSIEFFTVLWIERGYFHPGNSVPRFHLTDGMGIVLMEVLISNLMGHRNKDDLQVKFNHRVEDLLVENGQVVGCTGLVDESDRQFTAKAEHVVIASGGWTGNLERVKANWFKDWGDPPEMLLNGSHEAADGHIHDVAEGIGANITHVDKMWLYAAGVHHPNPRHELHGLSLVPPKSALWVNYEGRRIGSPPLISGFDTRYLVERISRQKHKYSWQILNYKIAVDELNVAGSEFNDAFVERNLLKILSIIYFGNPKLVNLLIDNCMDFVTANTVDELVHKMNAINGDDRVKKEILHNEILRFDENAGRGKKYYNDDQFRRIKDLNRDSVFFKRWFRKMPKILDPKSKPLIAIREFIVTRKSLGGIQTDLDCKVLNSNQEHIPGLYAVGESAGFGGGGIHGIRGLEGTFIGGCILTGRIAADSICRS